MCHFTWKLELVSNILWLIVDLEPEGKFFKKIDFYSSLKNKIVSDKEYEDVKKLFTILKMRNIGDLNELYNFEDAIMLCKIIWIKVSLMNKKWKFNPRRCNSVSTLIGCIHRSQGKFIIALPTIGEIIELSAKTLIGGFSLVNTRLAFDMYILMRNSNNGESINRKDLKVGYNLKNKKTNNYKDKRIASNILKMNKNN